MEIRPNITLYSTIKRWIPWLFAAAALVLSAMLGFALPYLSGFFAGNEWLVVAALLAVGPFLLLCATKFDWMVFVGFSLFGFVQIEPAPADALLMALFGIGLLIGKLNVKNLRDSSTIHFLIWGFVIINLFSMLPNGVNSSSLRYFAITGYMLALFYFLKLYVTSIRTMRIVIFGYLASGLISVLLVGFAYLNIGPADTFVIQSRAQGFFKDANVFGPFLIPLVIFLFDEYWYPRLIPDFKIAKLIGMAALSAGVFLSFSRAAWGALTLSILVYLLLNIRQMTRKQLMSIVWLALLGVVALVVIVVALDLQDFLLWRAAPLQTYDSDRFGAQERGIAVGLTHLFGVGPGLLNIGLSVHSLYIRTFAEHGILGLLTLLALITSLIYQLSIRSVGGIDKFYGISSKMLIASTIGLLMNSFVIDTLHWRHFWFILALLWAAATADKQLMIEKKMPEITPGRPFLNTANITSNMGASSWENPPDGYGRLA